MNRNGKRKIFYDEKLMDIEEYFIHRMQELGFFDETGKSNGVKSVGKIGYSRQEAEVHILGDFVGFYGLETKEEQEFIKKIGYEPEDFEDKKDLAYNPLKGIHYHGKQMDIEEYFTTCMKELGFYDEDGKPNDKDCVKGYYRSEAEFNILADYESSCGLETAKEQEFVKNLGYEPEDFINKEDLEYEQETDL